MSEYINCKELLKNLKQFAPEHLTPLIVMLIEKHPTADVFEVVRCKDCKYFFNDCCNHLKNRIIHKVPYFGADYVYIAKLEIKPDHYCSYGERMDGDTDDR